MKNNNVKKIVNPDNTVNYGCYNESVILNFEDYRVVSFFNHLKSWKKSKKAIKKFNYYTFIDDHYVIALGFVNLNFVSNLFVYVHKVNHGTIFKDQIDIMLSRKVTYEGDNYNCKIAWKNRDSSISIIKYPESIQIDFSFKNQLTLNASVSIPKNYERLIVCNPADFAKWTFTEKMYCLQTNQISAKLNNEVLFDEHSKVMVSSDWSAGFFRRETNWLWSAANGVVNHDAIGFNFAVMINDAFYPENAIWINHQRIIIPRILFDVNFMDPEHHPIRVYTLDRSIDLTFTICGLKSDVANRFGIVKTNFNQYVGKYSGTIKINQKTYQIHDLIGFFEIHKSIW